MSHPHSHRPNSNGYSMGPPKGSPSNAKTYYPFSTDLSPYPYSMPYNIPYPPHSLFYLYNKSHPYAQGSPYSAANQRLGPSPTNRVPLKKGVIEVIDLEKPLIKVEQA